LIIDLVNNILEEVQPCFDKMVEAWMLDGDIHPINEPEFFVRVNPDCPEAEVYESGYTLLHDRVPQNMSVE
jgi:hypothetical protein